MRSLPKPLSILFVALALLSPLGATAAEPAIDHYERKPSETLEQALANLKDYNALLEAQLAKGQLGPTELEAIHELTYTLEVALARMNLELQEAAMDLEALHQSSEAHDADQARKVAKDFLEVMGRMDLNR